MNESFKRIYDDWVRYSLGIADAAQLKSELKKYEDIKKFMVMAATYLVKHKMGETNGIEAKPDRYRLYWDNDIRHLKERIIASEKGPSNKIMTAEQFYKELKRSRSISAVYVYNNRYINIITKDLIYRGINIGKYAICIQSNQIRVYNATHHYRIEEYNMSEHPHIADGGNVCLGDRVREYEQLRRNAYLWGIITIILTIIQESDIQGSEYTSEQNFLSMICKATGQIYPKEKIGGDEWESEVIADEGDSYYVGTKLK